MRTSCAFAAARHQACSASSASWAAAQSNNGNGRCCLHGGSGLQPCSHPILPLITQQDRVVRGASLPSTWQQEDEDMQHAPSSPGEDSEMAQAPAHLPHAGGLGGPRQGRLVLANRAGTHGPTHLMLAASSSMASNSQPSQALLHRIMNSWLLAGLS